MGVGVRGFFSPGEKAPSSYWKAAAAVLTAPVEFLRIKSARPHPLHISLAPPLQVSTYVSFLFYFIFFFPFLFFLFSFLFPFLFFFPPARCCLVFFSFLICFFFFFLDIFSFLYFVILFVSFLFLFSSYFLFIASI
jgi:hypothetical protein